MCDQNNDVVGHTGKVTKEYFELLSRICEVSLTASPCIIKAMRKEKFAKSMELLYDIHVDRPFTLWKRIFDKIKLLKNIHKCLSKQGDDCLFFYQVDFFFFFYISLFYKKHRKKIYCLIFHQDFAGGKFENILKIFYKHALTKIDGIIYTQKGHPVPHSNICWIPDYMYSDERYLKYQKIEKQEKVVCVGTMNHLKQLEELVEIFREKTYRLEIIGRFDNLLRLKQLKSRASNNIVIEDELLSDREYYSVLASAKFSILPYDMDQYKNRTSGVLLESLYVGSIPIAPEELLNQNGLPGIGYERLFDLKEKDLSVIEEEMVNNIKKKVMVEFSEVRALEKLLSFFK